MKFTATSSPHIKNPLNIPVIMFHVILALMPATIAALFFFGTAALAVILTSVISAMVIEALINKIKKEPLTIMDGSAALTGLLFAFLLPPIIPLWMVVLGNVVGIGIVKHAFGGLGHNIFNPALTARLFLAVSYPITLTTWYKPGSWFNFVPVTAATPLADKLTVVSHYTDLFLGNMAGCIGETSAIAIILGAIWLFYKRILDWKIPFAFFASIIIFTIVTKQDTAYHLLTGGVLLGGFFMITDYVTSPITRIGRLLYGLMTGILVMSVRLFSNMPEGVAFSIVLMNAFVPLLDRIGVFFHFIIYNNYYKD